jgi:hypothetical protein
MRILELFSGTGSVGNVFQRQGWEVTSVDILPRCAGHTPTICTSVLEIELDRWPEAHFDVIWASPPCKFFSRANSTGARDYQHADTLVLHTLNLIRALKPRFFFVENPQSGDLRKRPYMQEFFYSDASYCKYSDWGYRKRTRIWHNCEHFHPRDCRRDCANMALNAAGRLVHRCSAQKGPTKGCADDRCFTSEQLYRIPPQLVEEIFQAVTTSW